MRNECSPARSPRLRSLGASGQAGNTIIAYCSDHAGVTLRSKRYLHDSGSRVPFILYFPEKWRHLAPAAPGTVSKRLVQFIDMPKTWLALAGIAPPETMTGHVFAGEAVEPEPGTTSPKYRGRLAYAAQSAQLKRLEKAPFSSRETRFCLPEAKGGNLRGRVFLARMSKLRHPTGYKKRILGQQNS